MNSVLKGLTFTILTVSFGLAMVPSASATDVLTQPAVIDNGVTVLTQPLVIKGGFNSLSRPVVYGGSTILTQPAVIGGDCNPCSTLIQPAILEPDCPALAPVYGASSFFHRPLFLGGTPVNGSFLSPSVLPRANWYGGALFGHGWY